MMGFNEEPGIIPRFCEDLFAEIAKKQTQEVCSHGLCKPSHSSRKQSNQVKIRVVATKEELSRRCAFWPLSSGTVVWGAGSRCGAVPPGGQRRGRSPRSSPLPRLYHLCGWRCAVTPPIVRVCGRGRAPLPTDSRGQGYVSSNRRLGSSLQTQPRVEVPAAHALPWHRVPMPSPSPACRQLSARQPARPVLPTFA